MNGDRPRVLLVGSFNTRFHRDIARGVLAFAHQRASWLLTCHTLVRPGDPERLRPDGVLSLEGRPEIEGLARSRGIPVVYMGNPPRTGEGSSVSCDEEALGSLAASHLAELGLKHFAYVGHGPWPFVYERRDSFGRAIEKRGLGPVHNLVGALYDRRRRPRFERDLRTMLQSLPRPCGVLAANDALGVEIVAACLEMGIRVPEEAAVLGVDDDELACELSEIPLSSVAQPLFAIGYEAARLLSRHMEDPRTKPASMLLPPVRVVARASSNLIAVDDAEVAGALRLINENFSNDINVDWLVRRLPVARRSLERRFKALVGRTLLGQIHHVRFQKARELLAESDLDLNVVAQRSGFANARWMADSFRRELRITPNRFRKLFREAGVGD